MMVMLIRRKGIIVVCSTSRIRNLFRLERNIRMMMFRVVIMG